MQNSIVLKKLAAGEPVFSAKACYADPEIVEMVGCAGFDCVWICLEHRQLDPTIIQSLVLASRVSACDCLWRVKPQSHVDLAFLLDAGARGIMVPHLNDAEEARRVVEMMKFPPFGRRGLDPIHADSNFGLVPLDRYVEKENETTFLVIQIETPEALRQVDAIAAIPGVDLLFIGLGDLSAKMGLLGQMDHPDLQDAVRKTGEACLRHGKAGAINSSTAADAERLWQLGYRFFNVGSDFRYIRSGLDASIKETHRWFLGAPKD